MLFENKLRPFVIPHCLLQTLYVHSVLCFINYSFVFIKKILCFICGDVSQGKPDI
ncbi:hypothetical protein GLYMA_06G264700v4 [Glycine max]|uniref:Uncharacterized protein n=2 Tax=Glycine subgen. Soja TaxID=1462606 RepID=K7KXK3_SOYBN|nr:hypothetical protein GYH30_016361 [Glycine max]KRH55589.1 hypothetical protein GLYMA_06G264700v4 [Glycine max]RZC09319.1 hypothetical protein D0Y65_015880 [Glycine soja]